MIGTSAQSSRMGRFWPPVFALFFLGVGGRCMGDGACLYQGDGTAGFLRIERLPDPHLVPMPSHSITIQTKNGKRELMRVSRGDCKSVFSDLLERSKNPEAPRLVVETKDQSYYSILLAHEFDPTMDTVAKVADKLGLEIVREQRRKPAFLIRANDEKRTSIKQFRGQHKWPEAWKVTKLNSSGLPKLTYGELVPYKIKKFPNGGILFIRWKLDDDNSVPKDDNMYFDGVSLDELAQYFEEKDRYPVVNRTGNKLLYCFTLPRDVWKQFSFTKTVPLPGLGLSVTWDEVEMEVLLVRDKRAGTTKGGN